LGESSSDSLALALTALSHKERSVAELGRWLGERGVAADEAEQTLAHLIEVGAVDDARFAARYAEDKRELAGWGSERIRAALLERGVGRADVEAAIGLDDDVTEVERAVALLRDRGTELGGERARSRALGLLARRGYGSEVAYEAIRVVEREG
jgi:regulatory protein